ncbi:MAG TPA: hypothetical protein DDW55_11625 [Gammaproteobacteria bacterium]|nr:hypothetical protein [Gammaproteobacteria bacterium]
MTSNIPDNDEVPLIQRIIAILWPSFLAAGAAMILLFVVFSPDELLPELRATGVSNMAIYSVTFIFLWATTLFACALSCYFMRPCSRCN